MTAPDRSAEDRSRWIVLAAATAVAVYLCWKILEPFLSVVLWSGVLALLFSPVQRVLARRLKRPSLAAALTLLIVLATVIVPVGLVTGALVAEISDFAQNAPARLTAFLEDPAYGGRIQSTLDGLDARFGLRQRLTPEALQEHVGALGQSLVKGTFSVVGGALGALVNLLFMLFALFYLLRDGGRFVDSLRAFLPMPAAEGDQLLERTRDIIQASVYGVLVIALLQGILGGLAFALLGIPSALLWGVVMTLLSILPMAGSGLVWGPAALILIAQGHWGKAIALALFGVLVIGSIDNFLRPRLVGHKARMHELVIFFAVLGGLRVFGILGIVFGPVLVAVTSALFAVFQRGEGGKAPEPGPPTNA
jgi:predicted PurR-regulated permease PerM